MLGHLDYAFKPERIFSIHIQCATVETATLRRQLHIHAKLVAELAFSTAILAIELGDGLRFQTAINHLVQSLATSRQPQNGLAHLVKLIRTHKTDTYS